MVEVAPQDWTLPNRAAHQPWVHKTFNESKYKKRSRGQFPHQRFIRDYMQFNGPFRGLLLFHEVGSGKTCTSLAAAEGFVLRDKNVFVLLPAALEPNYRKEILGCASLGRLKGHLWQLFTTKTLDLPTLTKEYGINGKWAKKQDRLWLPTNGNSITYIDEADGGEIEVPSLKSARWTELDADERSLATATLENMIDHRYQFIHYNGVGMKEVVALGEPEYNRSQSSAGRHNAFDNSFVVIDETHNFISRVTNGGLIARRLYDLIFEARNMKLVLLSATPVINHPFELAYTINLVRGPTQVYEFPLRKSAKALEIKDVHRLLSAANLTQFIDELAIDENEYKIVLTLLPFRYKWTTALTNKSVKNNVTSTTISRDPWNMTSKDVIEEILAALGDRVYTTVSKRLGMALPNSREAFERLFFTDPENPEVANEDLFMRRIQGLVSYFRMNGTDVFPTMYPIEYVHTPFTDYQFQEYTKIRAQERDIAKKTARRQAIGGLFGAKTQVYRAFSRMVSNFVFPEFAKRLYPSQVRKAMLSKQMDTNNDDGVATVDDDGVDADVAIGKKDIKRAYVENLDAVMRTLQQHPEALSQASLAERYSPKMAALLANVEASPGPALIYSQFRTCEGLGVLALSLDAAGYTEINIQKNKTSGEWEIEDADRVLHAQYDGRRYIRFPEDRAKQAILLYLFNGNFKALPATIFEKVRKVDQLHGSLVKVLMITQSGAEGISLKHVRTVHILEAFWNAVRIHQVIGRAMRTYSHVDLPPDERFVKVFFYISTFTQAQLYGDKDSGKKADFTLRRQDNSMTTDEHIVAIANRKQQIIDKFQDMMKRAAIDCIRNHVANELKSPCYAMPINMQPNALTFSAQISNENSMTTRARKWRGTLKEVNGHKIVEDDEGKQYDYDAYMAGVQINHSERR